MDAELLRRACERVGLEWESDGKNCPGGWVLRWTDEEGEPCSWHWWEDDPALPSYVADVLTGMVERMKLLGAYNDALCRLPITVLLFATPKQRITAAMEVLGDET